MTRLKYLDPADGQYKLLPVGGGGGGGAEEVVISAGVAPALNEELWVDTSATAPVSDWSYADNRYLSSGFRNVIRNGDFNIAQRGVGPFTTTNVYTLDGWVFSYTGGTVSLNRAVAAVGEASPKAVIAVSGQSAAGDFCQFSQYIEDVNTLNEKTVTISFDAWATSGTPKIGLEFQQIFGTGGTPSATQNLAVSAVTISTTRTRYSVTFNLPSVAGASLGTNSNHSLRLIFWVSAGSTYASRASNIGIQSGTFNLTDIQLEEGAAATRFERLPIQQQLAWCQRYFQRHVDPPMRGGVGAATTYASRVGMLLPVPMRATPSVATSGTPLGLFDGSNTTTAAAIAQNYSTPNGIEIDFTLATSLTVGRPSIVYRAANTAIMDLSAEL